MKLKGYAIVEVYDNLGNCVYRIEKDNYIFTENVYDILKENLGQIIQIGIGTDGSAGSSSDPATLKNVLREEDCTKERLDDYTIRCSHTFTYFDATYQIAEAGIKLDNDKYLGRLTFDPVTVDENNNIKIVYTVTVV